MNEYLRTGNGVQAARAAGYKGNGASLAVQASRLLRNANVTAALQEPLKAEEVTTGKLMVEAAKWAFRDPDSGSPFTHDEKARYLELLRKVKVDDEGEQQTISTLEVLSIVQSYKEREGVEGGSGDAMSLPPSLKNSEV
jgi:phage terminase small subunit